MARDDSAERVRQAYQRAKLANPKLTQREFAEKALPSITKKERKPDSGARYLRRILSGERSGSKIVAKSRYTPGGGRPDLYQVMVTDSKGGAHSFDMVGIGARSTLDIPLIEAQLNKHPEILAAKRAEWARRYGAIDLAAENVRIRRVTTHRKRSVSVSIEKIA